MNDSERFRRQFGKVLRQMGASAAATKSLETTFRAIHRMTIPPLRLPQLELASRLAATISPATLLAAQQQITAAQESVRRLTEYFEAGRIAIPTTFPQSLERGMAAILRLEVKPMTQGIQLALENRALLEKVRLPEYRNVARAINDATMSLMLSARQALRRDAELVRLPFSTVGTLGVVGAGTAEVGRAEGIRPALEPWDTEPGKLRARVYERLEELDPNLASKARGAWDALERSGPDATSQAAHSVQELIDHVIRNQAPDEDAKSWCLENYRNGIDKKGRVTRGGRIRYISAQRGLDPRSAEAIARAAIAVSKFAQGARHSLDFPDGQRIPAIVLVVEGFLGYLLL